MMYTHIWYRRQRVRSLQQLAACKKVDTQTRYTTRKHNPGQAPHSASNTNALTSIDCLCGASFGLPASVNAVCGVNRALSSSES